MTAATPQPGGGWLPGVATLYDALKGKESATALKVTEGGPVLTRGALQQCIVDMARNLQASGIKPGDVVSMAFANTVSGCWVALFAE